MSDERFLRTFTIRIVPANIWCSVAERTTSKRIVFVYLPRAGFDVKKLKQHVNPILCVCIYIYY
jgi:hypothetical protein